ncbi:hypothetical protein EBH_0006090 [Eimeria brunetti]|uniref:AAA+ ATPase domain-containing protein n=1 Tax=Eimeria brunetti TaxID=51314 RepID=U6LSF6_9EIME|nr:hypothetical protein EBH_0006090 [Eimeria brunetti]
MVCWCSCSDAAMAAIADALDKVERSGFQVALQQLLRLEQVDGKPCGQEMVPVERCGHSACLWESSLSKGEDEFRDNEVVSTTGLHIIVFGGCGGLKYERTALADLWSLDCDTWAWQQHTYTGTSPAPRQGHSAVVKGNMMFVFGGWSSEGNYNDLFAYDLENRDWFVSTPFSAAHAFFPSSMKGHCRCHWDFITTVSAAVAAAEQRETAERSSQLKRRGQGSIPNSSQQATPATADLPLPREGATMAYFAEDSTLVVFGGWSGKWLGDLWTCCVSSVVGPPYAVLGLSPPCGPMTGGTPIVLKGAGFTVGSIVVRFSAGDFFADVPGNFVSSTEVHAVTPNVKAALGPRTCEVRVKIGAKDLTSSLCSFQFYANSCASCCLAVGPGLLSDGAPGVPTSFFIEARNAQNGKRTTGGDTFVVQAYILPEASHTVLSPSYWPEQQELPQEISEEEEAEAKPVEPPVYLPVSIKDYGNGTYLATYTAPRPGRISVSAKVKHDDRRSLLDVRQHIKNVETLRAEHELYIEVLQVALQKLQEIGANVDSSNRALKKIGEKRTVLEASAEKRCHEMADAFEAEAGRTRKAIEELDTSVNALQQTLAGECFYSFSTSPAEARARIKDVSERANELHRTMQALQVPASSFDFPELLSASRQCLATMEDELRNVTQFWNVAESMLHQIEEYRGLLWNVVDGVQIEIAVKAMQKSMQKDIKMDKKTDAYQGLVAMLRTWVQIAPLITELRGPYMRERHWNELLGLAQKSLEISEETKLSQVEDLNLLALQGAVEEITDKAKQEEAIEKNLALLTNTWEAALFVLTPARQPEVFLLSLSEESNELLEEQQMLVQNMMVSKFFATFETEVTAWQKLLATIGDVTQMMRDVQRSWTFLENLFLCSEEVKRELPQEAERFVTIDENMKEVLRKGESNQKIKDFCVLPNISTQIDELQKQLSLCEKALNEFMDSKRKTFPRFFFVSSVDLLDILSHGNDPPAVMVHMPKIFQAIQQFDWRAALPTDKDQSRPVATGITSCVGTEQLALPEEMAFAGKVESYLQDCITMMRKTVRHYIKMSFAGRWKAESKDEWIKADPAAQATLLVNMASWVVQVEDAFSKMQETPTAMEKCMEKHVDELKSAIKLVQGSLTPALRQKIMCIITIDTHGRDIIQRLLDERANSVDCFQWQSQLKYFWDTETEEVSIRITDAAFAYGYEYLGNGPRLVVTPLTDRIYVTATQALHLCMGCAPAGPAGTGKTETTKDLASALGKACYVFNCSDQMDYQSMANIFKGLAASGSWGCFDEFNRLVPAVLSVCSVQFKSVVDAIKANAGKFFIQGDETSLDRTCGVFITMNPGYLGRSELPEGLKALFRPITVVVPDLELICENMLMAEGFVEAKELARKFTRLYALCKDLLSRAAHYDWGLRAIKSVLVVAGTFKREWPELSEQAILMKALRDSNLAKIVADDAKIFQGLLSDLFPGVEPPPQTDAAFSEAVVKVCNEMGLTINDGLALKALQMRDLLAIRMCVFVMGRPASGKSTVWKVLAKTQDALGSKTTIVDINPKSVNTDELYGYVKMSTREWQDGILSKTMRSLGQIPDTLPKWIVLDGDLDANWIESMNSVMDDNRILTLASNERIPLKPHMRMIFEIRDLNFASPATVSRAGIIFVSDSSGEQWRSYVQSWLQRQAWSEATKADVAKLFDKYCPATLEFVERQCKLSVQVYSLQIIAALCNMLEGLYPEEPQAPEFAFVFCLVWAAGGSLQEKDGIDYRRQFNNWWRSEWKVIKFPSKGSIFEYFVDTVPTLQFTGKEAIDSISVPTAETISMLHFCKTILKIHAPVMCIGSAGCGKTQLCKTALASLDSEAFSSFSVNFNFYTDSTLLQTLLEQPLEKKAGRQYGPPGKVHLVYFLDDLNMPQLDPYNTQSAIALLRQHMDYQHWLDRSKMQMKDISNTQVLAAMNPTAGSFVVNPRLSRHFWVLNVPMPELTSLFTIYASIMNGFFDVGNFRKAVKEQVMPVIKATMGIYTEVVQTFRKTAVNFHYEFNMRHLTNVFQGILSTPPQNLQDPEKLVLLWLHECERTFCDRLVTPEDGKKYRAIAAESYDRIGSMDELATILRAALNDYNELNPAMDLVLFDDAMHHVCRICRVINNRAGHALVVGVGGSGKQSLTRLSSFISGFATHQLCISSTYDIRDLKNDIRSMYSKAALKDEGVVFLLSDAQIANERFLVYVNDLLASGDIADLYEGDDKDQLLNSIRPLAKAAGVSDTREGCWTFFIDKIRRNLHAVLCLSPVGDSLRTRARKFPALVNCTVIDWFQPWPYEALHSVASKFCAALPIEDADSTRSSVVDFLPYMFYAVSDAAQTYQEVDRRFAYVTPKTFIEAMKLYQTMLLKRISSIEEHSERLSSGLSKLLDTQEKVSALEDDLREKTVAVEEKKAAAEEFAQKVGEEKAKVTAESENANVEALKCAEIQKSVAEQRASCEADLEKAIPLVEQAEAALNTLNKKDFQEAKALNKPPPGVEDITAAVMHLLATVDPIIEVDKQGKLKDKSWKGAQKVMNNPEKFLQTLKDFKSVIDDGRVPEQNFKAVEPLLALPHFNREAIQKKSTAAAGLAEWVVNIYQYYTVVVSVEPKRRALAEATQQLEDANKKLVEVQKLVAELEEKLGQLVAEFDSAIAEKNAVEAEAEKCQRKLDLAQRLMRSLGSEGARWGQTIDDLKEQRRVSIGDVLLSSSFVAYAGVFSKKYRDWLMYEKAVPFLVDRGVPLRQPADVLAQLTDEAEMALATTTLLTSVAGGAIEVLRLSTPRMVALVEMAIQQGTSVLIENLETSVDPVLAPVVGRQTIRRGRSQYLKLGDKEVSYNANFRLILQTRLSNPHYPPELQAECTLINFTVTEKGLEDQLLDLTMQKEQPKLFQRRIHLVQQQNEFTILLADLENTLLRDVSSAEGDVLENIELIQNLEKTKKVTTEVSEKVALAKITEEKLNAISEMYRPVARRGARLFFLLAQLFKIHSFYLFSMESFVAVINRAIDSISEKPQTVEETGAEPDAPEEAASVAAGEGDDKSSNNAGPTANCDPDVTNNSTEKSNNNTTDGESGVEDAQPEGESNSPAADNSQEAGTDGPKGEIRPAEQQAEPSVRSAVDEHARSEDAEEEDEKDVSPDASRVALLKDVITKFTFVSCNRGLFDKHKLTEEQNTVTEEEVRLLSQVRPDPTAPPMPEAARGWLSEAKWACCRSLEQLKSFKNNQISLLQNFDQDSLGWARWMAEDAPEGADLPRLFKGITDFEKLLLLRYLRPDRMISALQQFVSRQLGHFFVEPPAIDLHEIEKEADRFTPLFIVLFPGVDPTPVLEATARSKGCTAGQEERALAAVQEAAQLGGWVVLQNVHLMQEWLKRLQRTLEEVSATAHRDFRCVVTSEPPPLRDMQIIPEALLQRSIKIADEAPQDLKANLRRALCCFSQEVVDSCSRPREFKALLFSLCYFHALIIGRKKFGFLGWSRSYSFNEGDLTICGNVIKNYLDKYTTIPFEDIRYILGEIMYGGHITDGFDRRLNNTYLANLILPEVLQSYQLGPSFRTPDPAKTEFAAYQKFVEEKTPPENPQVFGLHPNAELGCLSSQSDELFTTLQEVSGVSGGGSSTGRKEDTVMTMVDSLLAKVPSPLDVAAIRAKVKEFHPATVVCLQEVERMNVLLAEARRTLEQLKKGLEVVYAPMLLHGALNVTDAMEQLEASLNMSRVPEAWKPYAYESRKQLGPWVNDLLHRVKQLEEWSADFTLPCPLWISGLFNPMSFLTAVMQVRARAESLALDRMCLRWTVTNIRYGAAAAGGQAGATQQQPLSAPETGVFIHGLFLEGAAWEEGKGEVEGNLTTSQPKVLQYPMPVFLVEAIPAAEVDNTAMYSCPVYLTSARGPTYVTTANLRMGADDSERRWILAGVALTMATDA